MLVRGNIVCLRKYKQKTKQKRLSTRRKMDVEQPSIFNRCSNIGFVFITRFVQFTASPGPYLYMIPIESGPFRPETGACSPVTLNEVPSVCEIEMVYCHRPAKKRAICYKTPVISFLSLFLSINDSFTLGHLSKL